MVNFKALLDGDVVGEKNLDLEIFPRGTLTIAGEIVDVVARPNVTVGEIFKIEAIFKNIGELPARSKLRAEIWKLGVTEQLVQTIESDIIEVGTGGQEKLDVYFKPSEPGKYLAKLSVLYEGKVTEVKEIYFEVLAPPVSWNTIALVGVGAVGIAVLWKRGIKK